MATDEKKVIGLVGKECVQGSVWNTLEKVEPGRGFSGARPSLGVHFLLPTRMLPCYVEKIKRSQFSCYFHVAALLLW